MVIYFSGIGGVGIGPLAEIALDAGYTVFGSDIQTSLMTEQLNGRGVHIIIGQDSNTIAQVHKTTPIDWFVYSTSLSDDNPELVFAREQGIRVSKRDELLSFIIADKQLKLVAIAGTHGKTTTTSLLVWCFKELGLPLSYSVGTTLAFGPSGKFDGRSEYFVYECDEYDRNFLHFMPHLSLIPSIDYDHPDTYKNEHVYKDAFLQFMGQSEQTLLWEKDVYYLAVPDIAASYEAYDESMDLTRFTLPGDHVRHNAFLVERALEKLFPDIPAEKIVAAINSFPGSGRRFEKLADDLYSDYGHHPAEIAATLQLARELSDRVTLVYQPHQNLRQHKLRDAYTTEVFKDADEIYWLPTYLTREDPNLPVLTPEELSSEVKKLVHFAELSEQLWDDISRVRDAGSLVLVMGAGEIDSWIRRQLNIRQAAGVLIVDDDGNFVLQRRENKSGITNPGKISGFGGGVEGNESKRDAALRELMEETNLHPGREDLHYLVAQYQDAAVDGVERWSTYFTLTVSDVNGLEVYEGDGYETIAPDERVDYPLTEGTKRLTDFYLKLASTK